MIILQVLLIPLVALILLGVVLAIGCDGISPPVHNTRSNQPAAWVDAADPGIELNYAGFDSPAPRVKLVNPDIRITSMRYPSVGRVDVELSHIDLSKGD